MVMGLGPTKLSVYPPELTLKPSLMVYPGAEEDASITPETLIGLDKFEPITIMLAGRRGRGKTAALTFLGKIFREAFDIHNVKAKVAANYNTDVAHQGPPENTSLYCNPYIIDDIMGFPEWADDLFVLVDEAAALFPRRRSTARINVDFSTFMQQIRKRDTEVAFTTQFPAMLDDQLLINIDLYCMVNMWPRHGWNAGKFIDLLVWDWHGQFTGKFTRPRIPPDGPPTWRRRFYNANQVFGHYNTKEIIGRLWASDQSRDAVASQYWAQSEAVAGPSIPEEPQVEPESIGGYLQGLVGRSFSIDRMLASAQDFDPGIRNRQDFIAVLEQIGSWDIIHQGKTWTALPKHGG